ncbi:MAG: tetratricopeptide repeat protein [Saprospiraceae bacterium]|nr:tetratricopeptide repeat protein [Saprospiraceae bacterium]MDW8229974.1 tetratricopeptide repeat protein [Saprospiraceae bacterium]
MTKKKPTRISTSARPAAAAAPAAPKKVVVAGDRFPWGWVLALMAFTGVLFWPMLSNQFTNWDDQFYVVENALLRGPDWKGIFSQPVVSNYHPLTILTLALNYQLSELKPFSYYFINWLLHIVNAGLVFYFVWLLAERRRWVALFVAAVFALHPMHVESVAWISERKDVLYTFFYLLGLIAYWRYLTSGKRTLYLWALGVFVLSLLSKPAAVAFPLTLLALDYWRGRSFREVKLWVEKAPFFALAFAMGVVTVLIQSQKAMASIEMYSLTHRLFFGCHTLLAYVWRFFWPWPLSPFHPYPPVNRLGWLVQASPVLLLAVAGAVWYFRRNRALVFGALFYLANIILVAQFVSIGNTLLAERYTYVPYIGIAFALAMSVALYAPASVRQPLSWGLLLAAVAGFSVLTYRYLDTWKNTESLWDTAIRYAPTAPVPRSNRANHYYQEALKPENASRYEALMRKAGEDSDAALKGDPKHYASLDIRTLTHVRLGELEQALPYAQRMVQIAPQNPKGHVLLGTVYQRMKRYDKAIEAFNQALALSPNDADALNGRGASLFNGQQKYREALADFDKAIAVQPNNGMALLNRSRCYYMLGDKARARENAEKARAAGTPVPEDYWQLIQ